MAFAVLGSEERWVSTPSIFASILLVGGAIAMASRMLGYAKTTYYHSTKSLPLKTNEGKATTLAEVCKAVIPPCRLNPLIFNGHLHTIWTLMKQQDIPVYYKRRIFESTQPVYTGEFAVDFVTKPYTDTDATLPPRTTYLTKREFEGYHSSDTKPMLVILHGLTGGSHELYLRAVLAPLVSEAGGWEACVINSRGCCNTKLTSTLLYNARSTWDIRQIVKLLRERFPNRPLYGCGFSLGANMITNYAGEEGINCDLKAVVAVSSPWSLEISSLALQRTWIGLNIYSRALGKNLLGLFMKHVDQISKNPKIDVDTVKSIKYLHEFDRYVQGPTWGYPTEQAYYRDASSIDSVFGIKVPYLAIHAEDDPVASQEALPREEVKTNPFTVLCTTSSGGHLGWFEIGGGRWFATAVVNFLQKVSREIDLEQYSSTNGVTLEGHISDGHRDTLKPVFDPMRRRLYILEET